MAAVNVNKLCSAMTLYSGSNDMLSHQVRIVLAEKAVSFNTKFIESGNFPQDLIDLSPHQSTPALPTLVDRSLTLFEPHTIMEYLDERFPHPPLMPVYPVARAESRLLMHRIKMNWYSLVKQIETGSAQEAQQARKQLLEELMILLPIFQQFTYFMSGEFSLTDCYLAPLLWRLPALGIELSPNSKPLQEYMKRIFDRDSFFPSLTEAERKLNTFKFKMRSTAP